jgi:2-methylcitrate dehydratase PrpD
MHAGNASRNGITSAILAKKGFTGDRNIIEGKFGLMNALAGESNYDIEKLIKTLGNPYSVIDPGINIKPYPNCWAHHRVYDAILFLVNRFDINFADVDRVECDLQPDKPTYRYLEPQNEFEAKYSLAYGLSMCLLDRKLQLEQYKKERIAAEDTKNAMAKVKHVPKIDVDEKHTVSIWLKDGKIHSYNVKYSKGHAIHNALSDKELISKYQSCASSVLDDEKIEMSINQIKNLDKADDLSKILDVVSTENTEN